MREFFRRKKKSGPFYAAMTAAAVVAGVVLWEGEERARVAALVTPDTTTEFWAMLATLGTLFLGYIAAKGLTSLGLAKKDIQTRSQREAIAAAINACDVFRTEIIPATSEFQAALVANKVPLFVDDPAKVQLDDAPPAELNRAVAWYNALQPEMRSMAIKILNQFEAWSMNFTSGFADSKLAYGPTSTLYCQTVLRTYPVLLIFRQVKESGKFPNTVDLYKRWSSMKTAEEVEAQVRDLRDKASKIGDHEHPPPIGTI